MGTLEVKQPGHKANHSPLVFTLWCLTTSTWSALVPYFVFALDCILTMYFFPFVLHCTCSYLLLFIPCYEILQTISVLQNIGRIHSYACSRSGNFEDFCLLRSGESQLHDLERTCCFHPICYMLVSCLAYSLNLKMETSLDFQQTTWCYNPEDRTLQNHCCENLKSKRMNFIFK
jgi:hypothetical protein